MTGPVKTGHWQPLLTAELSPRFDCSRIDLGQRTPRTIYLVWTPVGFLSEPGKHKVGARVLSSAFVEFIVDEFAIRDAETMSSPIATHLASVKIAQI